VLSRVKEMKGVRCTVHVRGRSGYTAVFRRRWAYLPILAELYLEHNTRLKVLARLEDPLIHNGQAFQALYVKSTIGFIVCILPRSHAAKGAKK
jgi:hypothetical protein